LWAGIGIASFIVFVLLLLSVPFDLAMQLEVYGKPDLHLRWAWFFGLVRKEIKARRRRLPEKKREKKRKFNVKRMVQGIRTGMDYLRIEGLIHHLIQFMKRVFRRIQIRKLEAEFYAGLDDPYETFYIFALTQPFNLIIDRFAPYAISIQPSWVGLTFEGQMRAEIRVYPIRLVTPLLQFLFSRAAFRVIITAVKSRWKRKR
jgi:hypothetical protein